MGKRIKSLLIIISVLFAVITIIFLPTFNLKTGKMVYKETDNFIFYYEKQDEKAVVDMTDVLEKACKRVNEYLNYSDSKKTEVYVYPNLNVLHTKKYGYIVNLIELISRNNLDWYIGDNIKDKVIIVSPLNPGPVHDYNTVVQATLHEYVHTVVYKINKDTPKFINEGLAGYISQNAKPNYSLQNNPIPSLYDTKISNPIKFANKNLYTFSYTYIDFLDKNYGKDKIAKLVRNPSAYKEVFGESEEEIYERWVEYVKKNYY